MGIIASLYAYRYVGLLIGTFFEGPIVMAATGFLIKLGYFDILPAYLLLMAGDLFADIAWYYVGHFGAKTFIHKFGRFFGVTESIVEKVKGMFHRHHNKIIFFSKITMGFGMAVPILITAGISKVPIKRYILLNFLGGFIWTVLLMTLGYFFGNIYILISDSLKTGFVVGIVILLVAMMFGFSKFLRTEVLKNKIL
jgi:membrane protein DedA with SNARE-associated domain